MNANNEMDSITQTHTCEWTYSQSDGSERSLIRLDSQIEPIMLRVVADGHGRFVCSVQVSTNRTTSTNESAKVKAEQLGLVVKRAVEQSNEK